MKNITVLKREKKRTIWYRKRKHYLKKNMEATTQIALHSKSLLHNLNNNRAEQFNSIVAKYIGGKRVNFSRNLVQPDATQQSSLNSAQPQYVLYKSKFHRSLCNLYYHRFSYPFVRRTNYNTRQNIFLARKEKNIHKKRQENKQLKLF